MARFAALALLVALLSLARASPIRVGLVVPADDSVVTLEPPQHPVHPGPQPVPHPPRPNVTDECAAALHDFIKLRNIRRACTPPPPNATEDAPGDQVPQDGLAALAEVLDFADEHQQLKHKRHWRPHGEDVPGGGPPHHGPGGPPHHGPGGPPHRGCWYKRVKARLDAFCSDGCEEALDAYFDAAEEACGDQVVVPPRPIFHVPNPHPGPHPGPPHHPPTDPVPSPPDNPTEPTPPPEDLPVPPEDGDADEDEWDPASANIAPPRPADDGPEDGLPAPYPFAEPPASLLDFVADAFEAVVDKVKGFFAGAADEEEEGPDHPGGPGAHPGPHPGPPHGPPGHGPPGHVPPHRPGFPPRPPHRPGFPGRPPFHRPPGPHSGLYPLVRLARRNESLTVADVRALADLSRSARCVKAGEREHYCPIAAHVVLSVGPPGFHRGPGGPHGPHGPFPGGPHPAPGGPHRGPDEVGLAMTFPFMPRDACACLTAEAASLKESAADMREGLLKPWIVPRAEFLRARVCDA